MAKIDVYDISNYLPYDEDLGIYDLTSKDNELVNRLKALPVHKNMRITGELLDSVAYKVYEDEKLWWVLAIYNDIIDTLSVTTMEIAIPSLNHVESILIDMIESRK